MSKKYVYPVCISADSSTTGFVVLTKKQAKIVERVASMNWLNKESNPYSGRFSINTICCFEATEEEVAEWKELNS